MREIRQVVNDALVVIDSDIAVLHADFGRPSIAPERLIRASLLQIPFSIRSERQLMEQVQYNLMFRWFVGSAIGRAIHENDHAPTDELGPATSPLSKTHRTIPFGLDQGRPARRLGTLHGCLDLDYPG